MSFAGTPLGQGRRLDHQTFLGKPPSNGNKNPQRITPTSYAYGAPALGSRSPPKATSSRAILDHSDNNQLDPEKWSVRDTTVNAASAIFQAAAAEMQSSNPNNSSWASGSRPTSNVPRSTSVEYESQTQSTTTRRLNGPPSRLGRSNKPISKHSSSKSIVPDSEPESQDISREKSPFSLEHIAGLAQSAIQKTSYFVKEREREPNGSYDYSAEERDFQQQQQSASSRRINPTHRKNRISTDNKAYKPTQEELEEESDDSVSDGGRRRRKKKTGPAGGPLTSLPTVGREKRRRKTKKGVKGTGEEEEEEEETDREEVEQTASHRATSIPPPPPQRRTISRQGSLAPDSSYDNSRSLNLNLDAIPEDPEAQAAGAADDSYSYDEGSLSSLRIPHDGLGAKLGSYVFILFRFIIASFSHVLHGLGWVLGRVLYLVLLWPIQQAKKIPVGLVSYFLVAVAVVFGAWLVRDPLVSLVPVPRISWSPWSSSATKYTPPGIPIENIDQFNTRLQAIEAALSSLVLENEQTRLRTVHGDQSRGEVISRLGTLEGAFKAETNRVAKVESAISQRSEKERWLLEEVESLRSVVGIIQQQEPQAPTVVGAGSDEEARARVAALEERVGSVEGGVKEALDLGKNAIKAGDTNSGWWNKLSTKKDTQSITIKSTDGQDITSLLTSLITSAISLNSKDTLARPDYALHSGGARVIPSLTSDTYTLRPKNLRSQILSILTGSGSGYAIGRPPVWALHPDLTNGLCWPFKGGEGQLGVALAAPTYVEDVTIDHVAMDVAYDVRSAPKEMEVWGMVEGRENIVRVREFLREWERERERQTQGEGDSESSEGDSEDREESRLISNYPPTLPKNPLYIRIASFTYDINSSQNIQTFSVFPEVKELGVDFGIVVLRVRSNWGMEDYTCLYRMRVHGTRLGDGEGLGEGAWEGLEDGEDAI